MVVDIIFAGVLCCIAMDLWQRLLFIMYKIPPTNWAPTGRWLLMLMNKGIIFNINLENEKPIKYELPIGWIFHYIVGIGYGFAYWICLTFFDFFNTSLLSGFLFGLISVVVPWFFFLPATGKGLMGNKTPNPKLTKILSTCSHIVVGLFLAVGFSLMEY